MEIDRVEGKGDKGKGKGKGKGKSDKGKGKRFGPKTYQQVNRRLLILEGCPPHFMLFLTRTAMDIWLTMVTGSISYLKLFGMVATATNSWLDPQLAEHSWWYYLETPLVLDILQYLATNL